MYATCYVFRPVLRQSSGKSIQKSYITEDIIKSTGPLIYTHYFYSINTQKIKSFCFLLLYFIFNILYSIFHIIKKSDFKKGAPQTALYLPIQDFCIGMPEDRPSTGRNM